MKKYAFLIIDTETTGLADDDEMLEFAACAPDGSLAWRSLCKPERHQEWPDAEKINRISPADVEFAMTAGQQKEGISDLLSSTALIAGYNVQFDIRVLKRSGIELPRDLLCADIMDAVVDRFGKRMSLADACAALGIAFGGKGPHSAGADARAAIQVFTAISLCGISGPCPRAAASAGPSASKGGASADEDALEELLHADRRTSENFMRYAYAIF